MAIIILGGMDGGGHWGSGVCIAGGTLFLTDELETGRRHVVLRPVEGSGSRSLSGSGLIRIRDILRGDTIT